MSTSKTHTQFFSLFITYLFLSLIPVLHSHLQHQRSDSCNHCVCRGLYDIIPSAVNAFFLSAVSYIHINPDATHREHAGVWSGPESPYVVQTKKKKRNSWMGLLQSCIHILQWLGDLRWWKLNFLMQYLLTSLHQRKHFSSIWEVKD